MSNDNEYPKEVIDVNTKTTYKVIPGFFMDKLVSVDGSVVLMSKPNFYFKYKNGELVNVESDKGVE